MITITKEFHFEAAHFLPLHPGLCKHLHGHSYRLKITVSHENKRFDPRTKMVMDFGTLKAIVNEKIISKMDHSYLNETYAMPTAEFMVEDFAKTLQAAFAGLPVNLEKISLWETLGSEATWTPTCF